MKPLIYLMGHVKTSLSVLVAIDFMVASPSSSTPSTSIILSVQSNGSIWFQISEALFFWSLAKLNLTAGSSGGALYFLWNSRNHSPVGTIGNDDWSVELLSQSNVCSDAIDVSTGWTTIWSRITVFYIQCLSIINKNISFTLVNWESSVPGQNFDTCPI